MKRVMDELLNNALRKNKHNYIIYYRGHSKEYKTYKEVSHDIDEYSLRLQYLKTGNENLKIGILGNVSYDWLLCDLSCIKSGIKSVALLEYLSENEISKIVQQHKIGIVLLDYNLKDCYPSLVKFTNVLYINCPDASINNNLRLIPTIKEQTKCSLLDEYGMCFSSGTSGIPKCINLKWPIQQPRKGLKGYINSLTRYLWSKKKNTIIIYMPFSHFQQREFVFQALLLNINIILSDSINCMKHIIINKPNVMVSVPTVYELLAYRMQEKIKKLPTWKLYLFKIFTGLRLNELSNYNPLKFFFSYVLFRDIRKLYGGKATYFVCGSAPITLKSLQTFYNVGVKILEAYGQSEFGMIAMNTQKHFRLGSVGMPMVQVKISNESEVLIKYEEKKNFHNRAILNIDSEGFIHTGDLGYIDEDGFLFLKGRKDNVIVLANGRKIFPEEVELIFKEYCQQIHHAFVFSSDYYVLKLIVSIKHGIKMTNEEVRNVIRESNKSLSEFQRVKCYYIAQEPFTSENGLLTSTLKMRREHIMAKYEEAIFVYV